MKIKIDNIDWDKDEGDDTELPTTVTIDIRKVNPSGRVCSDLADRLSDWLSDEYGYCHNGFTYDVLKNKK